MTQIEKPSPTYFERLAKRYGANIFLLIAIGYLYKAQLDSETKIQALESRVFECYESRANATAHNSFPTNSSPSLLISKEAVLTGSKKRYYRTRIS